eukprot:COSAG02_NODE_2291_length_9203_cov_4.256920_3_plen_210_part_00
MRAVCIPWVQFQGDISSDRTVLAPVTALPWINEAVLAANTSSSRPGQTQTGVCSFVFSSKCFVRLAYAVKCHCFPGHREASVGAWAPSGGVAVEVCPRGWAHGQTSLKHLPSTVLHCCCMLLVAYVCAPCVTLLQGEEAVLVSMKKAIDICVYYTLGREAKVNARVRTGRNSPEENRFWFLIKARCCMFPGATAGVQGPDLGNISASAG